MVVVVDGTALVVVVGVVEHEVSVVVGSPTVLVVDIGANVEVVAVSSPEADWHPAALITRAATTRRERSMCIGLGCYGRRRPKRSFVTRIVGILE